LLGGLAAVFVLGLTLGGVSLWILGGRLAAAVPRDVGPPPTTLVDSREVSFPSDSGSTISGWFAPGALGRACIVLAHPVRGDRRGMLGRAVFLQREGYGVLLFDEQAHGESTGERITFGHLEALDAVAAVGWARTECTGAPIGYIGVSQGGAAALLGPEPLRVDALVLEAVYPTISQAIENRIAIRLGPPGRLLAPLLLWQLELRLGIAPESLEPLRGIPRIRAPLLLIAGARDRHTPEAEARELYRAAPEPKELWIVSGAAHVNLHAAAREEYERRVLRFLRDTLGGR
jgi:fermentation-respiration switch protein FrsA (DUF1100 family)